MQKVVVLGAGMVGSAMAIDLSGAFEVTADKRIVWEYISPFRAGDEQQLIATLFDLVRLPPDFPIEWATVSGAGSPR